jgi:hypothetical protein
MPQDHEPLGLFAQGWVSIHADRMADWTGADVRDESALTPVLASSRSRSKHIGVLAGVTVTRVVASVRAFASTPGARHRRPWRFGRAAAAYPYSQDDLRGVALDRPGAGTFWLITYRGVLLHFTYAGNELGEFTVPRDVGQRCRRRRRHLKRGPAHGSGPPGRYVTAVRSNAWTCERTSPV